MTARARRRPTLGAAGVVVLAVALGACTGEPSVADPVPVASTSSPVASATPTPSPTATAPAWDAAMDQVTVDGALAVGRYFLELFPYVIETGDTGAWLRLSHPDCTFCSEVAASAAQAQEPQSSVRLSVDTAEVQVIETDVLFKGTYSLTETHADGSSENVTALVAIVASGAGWQIRGVQFEPAATAGG